jgi:crotonobetainyl-CoA:carnitine CoA-transferase CaiB-like acyl-CoA transferase
VGEGGTVRGSALDGLLVADFSSALAGPYLTMLLGDLGATVVKVESPAGDATRTWGPPWHRGAATYFHAVNRDKRSVVLDLRDEDQRALALELATRADVLVENLRPGAMARFGLGYEDVAARNPALICCSISGFGTQPGGAEIPGYDLLGQAVGGLMSITGPEGGPPHKVGVALVDVLCGLHGAVAILAALAERARSGLGQRVEVDLLSSVLSALANQASGFLLAGSVPGPMGNAHPSLAPYETLAAADGDLVIAVATDRQFASLCSVLGRDDLAADERFATNPARVGHRAELLAELKEALADRTRDEVVGPLRARGVPCGPVNDVAEAFAFAREIGLEPTWTLDGDAHVRAPFALSATPPRAHRGAPTLDEHGDEVRAWLRGPAGEAFGATR